MLKCVRAPNCFTFSKIKFLIPDQKMYHFYFNFSLIMSKSTKLFILTLESFVGVTLAELSFITGRMINLLDLIMREITILFFAVRL